ncbi:MAG: SDR family oxidoreductase [Gammaproteobacteria bacterium]|nr:SDR family oxidoreductase [Gammaproteobacteria bacterium]
MSRRVAIITDTEMHLGPDLALAMARREHDLVIGNPRPGLVPEIEALGARVIVHEEVAELAQSNSLAPLIDDALTQFGRLDAACIRTGTILSGELLSATMQDFDTLTRANMGSVFSVLQQLLPPMIEARSGQVVIVTSATGARPSPAAALYSSTRAGANMMVRNAAMSVAEYGVTVNALGTNFLEYPGFMNASGAGDPARRARIEAGVPLRRLGQPQEVAHFCASLLDGENRFQTGQFFSLSGGWSE